MIDRETTIKTACDVIRGHAEFNRCSIMESLDCFSTTEGGYGSPDGGHYCFDRRGFQLGASTMQINTEQAKDCYFVTWKTVESELLNAQTEFDFTKLENTLNGCIDNRAKV